MQKLDGILWVCVAVFGVALGCGRPINLGTQASVSPKPIIVPGMILYLDASFVNGSFGVPSTPCGESTWVDLSGNGNHGMLAGFACDPTSGWTGLGTPLDPYRLAYDGNNGRIATDLDVQPSAIPETTWEGWIRPTRIPHTARQAIFSSDDGAWDRQLLIEANSNKLSAFTGTAAPNVFEAASLVPNEWQHVAVTYTASDVVVYLNGVKYAFGSAPVGMDTNNKLTLGTNPGFGEVFNGGLAYLTVYNRALSDDEIVERCRALSPRFDGATCN